MRLSGPADNIGSLSRDSTELVEVKRQKRDRILIDLIFRNAGRIDPISEFLEAAAAKQPTPGGGSIAALAGALAASMAEMALNYSVNKKDLQQHRPELESALAEINRARNLLLGLMLEDQSAYESLAAARKEKNNDSIEASLAAAITVPQTIGATAIALMEICGKVAGKVNKLLLSDLAVCAELAMATARCASYNIRANLSDMNDAGEREKLEGSADRLVTRGVELIKDISPRIWQQGTSDT